MDFQLVSDFKPEGDQPQAINELTEGVLRGDRAQVLLGVTGSGKTFTMAHVVANIKQPALIISHNKTLAAQLYSEFKQFFPNNAVEYFVSYYDYYQPEAYVPTTDTYIEKDASINEQIDRLRLKATSSLLERRDVIIVASVSCIYGIGSPEEWKESVVMFGEGDNFKRKELLKGLVSIQYERNDVDFSRGRFRVRGDSIEIFPAYLETALRVELFGDQVDRISEIDPLTGKIIGNKKKVIIYPAKHFVTTTPRIEEAIEDIKKELEDRCKVFERDGKLLEAQRLRTRTNFDIEMMQETGYCTGIENYSRHLSRRKPGEPPACLINYFPSEFVTIIDESHVTMPQLNGMYNGDHSRKKTLVDYGFRLPSALDNRPLKFDEFEHLMNQVIYVSATPGPYELKKSKGVVVEQVIRPTGLVDPEVEIRPIKSQVDDLIREIDNRVSKSQRTLVTTLTKRLAEELTEYLSKKNLKVRYLHSEIDALTRVEILRDLRKGEFDCLVGINLLREGLDLPEVALVAVLDADKEGFLRSETSLIQVCGRAARNVEGKVIMYADHITGSMRRAIGEMDRRRRKQLDYNKKYNITPRTIEKNIHELEEMTYQVRDKAYSLARDAGFRFLEEKSSPSLIKELENQMREAADRLDFELAAMMRDKLIEIKGKDFIKKTGVKVKRRTVKTKASD